VEEKKKRLLLPSVFKNQRERAKVLEWVKSKQRLKSRCLRRILFSILLAFGKKTKKPQVKTKS
jgi:hypothetical protein